MDFWQEFLGPNIAYVLELYDRYRQDPQSVDEATRKIFNRQAPSVEDFDIIPAEAADRLRWDNVWAAAQLAQLIRDRGHWLAQVDPLGSQPPGGSALPFAWPPPDADRLRQTPAAPIGGAIAESAANALEALQALHGIYCAASGYEYAHLQEASERTWLQEAIEGGLCRPPLVPVDGPLLLERLTQVEVFERFLHRTFPGKTRFSIEGVDMLIPMLDQAAGLAIRLGIRQVFLGMAHRGRLNVMAHILQKPYAQILNEFKDLARDSAVPGEAGWTGDVKYHAGACQGITGSEESQLTICMPPNPSHLECVYPVVEGAVRAVASQVNRAGAPPFLPDAALAIIIHGESSFPGQGVVAETLNLAHLAAYQTGGTLHIITNNQLGYTATAQETRSSLYASDLALGFRIPVIHVNADAPEACLEAVRLALAYRARFHKDFLIDLVGYRRYGHNEGDEPAFTQPVMYRQIQSHPTVRELWAQALQGSNTLDKHWPETIVQKAREGLQAAYESLKTALVTEPLPEPQSPPTLHALPTAVPLQELDALNAALLELPAGFKLHRKLQRPWEQRRAAFQNPAQPTIDWSLAESLALATILQAGIAIRLTGEDVGRGTFSQRHAVLYDEETGAAHIPLQTLPQAQAACEVANSPVTEMATLGFELGYSLQASERLVLWEAQYGDFSNMAQVMIDEFIASARAKWRQFPALVMLLPHGNEGQGPDHSSANPARFLQLAADDNLRIVNPTTAAQYFHLLRQQALQLKAHVAPLVVFTPKGHLRHPLTASPPLALAQSGWQNVIAEAQTPASPHPARRLVLCSGRIYIDLAASPLAKNASGRVALARLEQLYPFPQDELKALLAGYPDLEAVVWAQEEPQNMGAWQYLSPRLSELIGGRWPLHYVGRPPSSSPGEGSARQYAENQRALIGRVFSAALAPPENGILSRERP